MNVSHRPLAGRRVAITGAARGIGRATAQAFHDRGAMVVIGDLDLDLAREAARDIGERVTAEGLDVTDTASFEAFLERARKAMGGLDVLVNNAGIMPIGPFLEQPEHTVRRALEINVLGPILGMRLALPAMLAQGHGHIVNVASSAGIMAVPGGATYCATKAAVLTLTEGARMEFGDRGIDFTAVLPAFTNTELIAGTTRPKMAPTVEPEVVAAAIVDGVERRRLDVYVPTSLKTMARLGPLLGRRLRDVTMRRSGAHTAFMDIDHSRRQAYDDRIAGN